MDIYKSSYIEKCLKDLKNGQTDDIITVIQKTFQIGSRKSADNTSLACRYLRTLCNYLKDKESMEVEEEASIYSSVSSCLAYIKHNYEPFEIANVDSYFANYVYYIIEGLLRKKFYDHALELCKFLRDHMLQGLSSEKISCRDPQTITRNLCHLLWNTSIEFEKNSKDREMGFKIRSESLHFMLFNQKDVEEVCEKLTLCVQRYCITNSKFDANCLKCFLASFQSDMCKIMPCSKASCLKQELFKHVCCWGMAVYKLYFNVNILSLLHEYLGNLYCPSHSFSRTLKICIDILRFCISIFALDESSSLPTLEHNKWKEVFSLSMLSKKGATDVVLSTCNWFYYIFAYYVQTVSKIHQEEMNRKVKENIDVILLLCDACLVQSLSVRTVKAEISSLKIFGTDSKIGLAVSFLRVCDSILEEQSETLDIVHRYLEIATKYVQKVETLLSENTNENHLSQQRIQQFVAVTANLSRHCYRRELYAQTVLFYEVILKNLQTDGNSIFSELGTTMQKEYELLVSSYVKTKQLYVALKCIVKFMLLNESSLQMWLPWWVRVKRRAIDDGNEDLVKKTIIDMLDELNLEVDPAKKLYLLKQELAVCKRESKYNMVEEISQICLYMAKWDVSKLPLAEALLEVSQIPEVIPEQFKAFGSSKLELCKKTVLLFEEACQVSPDDCVVKLKLSLALFWQHHHEMVKRQTDAFEEIAQYKLSLKEKKNEETTSTAFNAEDDNEDEAHDIKPAFAHVTVGIEAEAMKSLFRVADLLKEICHSKDAWPDIAESIETYDILNTLLIMAEMFALAGYQAQELKICCVLREICCKMNNYFYEVLALEKILGLLTENGFLSLAGSVVDYVVNNVFPLLGSDEKQDHDVKLKFRCTQSAYYLNIGEYPTAYALLKSISESLSSRKSSKSRAHPLQIRVNLLKSQLSLIAPTAFGDLCLSEDELPCWNTLALLMTCVHQCKGFLKWKPFSRVVPYDNASMIAYDNKSLVLEITQLFLKSSFMTAEVFKEIGWPYAARFVLKESLAAAQSLVLTQWSARILVSLGSINILCNEIDDCEVKLNGLKYILKMDQILDAEITKSINAVSKFANDSTKGSEDDFLNTGPDEISVAGKIRLDLKKHYCPSPMSPVTHRRRKIASVETCFNFMKCDCQCCTTCSLAFMSLELGELNCLYLSAKGLIEDALQGCDIIKSYSKRLNNSNGFKETFLSFESNRRFPRIFKKSMSKRELHLVVRILVFKALASASACKFDQAQSLISEAISIIRSEAKKPETSHPHLLAYVVYHKALISVQESVKYKNPSFGALWSKPSDQKYSDIDVLSKSIEELSITKTPVKSDRMFARQCKAPMKKNILPSEVKKALLSLQSDSSTSINNSSTDDDVTKVLNTRTSPLVNVENGPSIVISGAESEGDDDAFISVADETSQKNPKKPGRRRVSVGKKSRNKINDKSLRSGRSKKGLSKDTLDGESSAQKVYKFFKSKASQSSAIDSDNCSPVPNMTIKSSSRKERAVKKGSKNSEKNNFKMIPVVNNKNTFSLYSDPENIQNTRVSTRSRAKLPKVKADVSDERKAGTSKQKNQRKMHLKSNSVAVKAEKPLPAEKSGMNCDFVEPFSVKAAITENQIYSMEKVRKSCSISEMSEYQEISRECSRKFDSAVNLFPSGDEGNHDQELKKGISVEIMKISENISNNKEFNIEAIISELQNALMAVEHYPFYNPYPYMCKLLAVLLLSTSKQLKSSGGGYDEEKCLSASYFLTESFAVTLRHRALLLMAKKFSSNGISKSTEDVTATVLTRDNAIAKYKELSFQKSDNGLSYSRRMQALIDKAPENCTIVQMCTAQELYEKDSPKTQCAPKLIICRYRKGTVPCVVQVDNSSKLSYNLMDEFRSIMTENKLTMGKATRKLWWSTRTQLDKRLENFFNDMENKLLGGWKCLFLGKPMDEKRSELLEVALQNLPPCSSKELVRAFLDGAPYLKDDAISSMVSDLWHSLPHDSKHSKLCTYVKQAIQCLSTASERHPVIMVLDKDLQRLPWENMPILKNAQVTRVPSVCMLNYHLTSCFQHNFTINKEIDSDRTFYILNPGRDLLFTQEMFEKKFQAIKTWEGIISRMPTPAEYIDAVANYELFLYLGHGSGSRFLDGELFDIRTCGAVCVLMGCSSGLLTKPGPDLEVLGTSLNHWLSGSPCIVGTLWNVTDKDIDRFTEGLLEKWLPNYGPKSEPGVSICHAVSYGRDKCKMKNLIGGAPVIYGLPLCVKNGN